MTNNSMEGKYFLGPEPSMGVCGWAEWQPNGAVRVGAGWLDLEWGVSALTEAASMVEVEVAVNVSEKIYFPAHISLEGRLWC